MFVNDKRNMKLIKNANKAVARLVRECGAEAGAAVSFGLGAKSMMANKTTLKDAIELAKTIIFDLYSKR